MEYDIRLQYSVANKSVSIVVDGQHKEVKTYAKAISANILPGQIGCWDGDRVFEGTIRDLVVNGVPAQTSTCRGRVDTPAGAAYQRALAGLADPFIVDVWVTAPAEALVFVGDAARDAGYEIALGADGGANSYIRTGTAGPTQAVHAGPVLDPTQPVQFTIAKSGTDLKVYHEGDLLMHYAGATQAVSQMWVAVAGGAGGGAWELDCAAISTQLADAPGWGAPSCSSLEWDERQVTCTFYGNGALVGSEWHVYVQAGDQRSTTHAEFEVGTRLITDGLDAAAFAEQVCKASGTRDAPAQARA